MKRRKYLTIISILLIFNSLCLLKSSAITDKDKDIARNNPDTKIAGEIANNPSH